MRNKVLLTFAILLSWSTIVPAQSDRLLPHGGFTYQFITLRARVTNATALGYYYGLTGGINYVLMHSNDQVAIGVDPNAVISISLSNFGTSLLLQTPVYFTARVGAGCTPFNESKIGVGVGVGPNFTFINESNGVSRSRATFFSPTAMGELCIRTRGSDYLLRVNFTPFQTTSEFDGQDVYFSNFGFGILYSF
jgi:hypothetical protein